MVDGIESRRRDLQYFIAINRFPPSVNVTVRQFNGGSGIAATLKRQIKGEAILPYNGRLILYCRSLFHFFFTTKGNFFLFSSRETIQQYIYHDRIRLTSRTRSGVV